MNLQRVSDILGTAKATPGVGVAVGGSGRSIFRFGDIDAAVVVEVVAEFLEDEKMSAAAVESEDV